MTEFKCESCANKESAFVFNGSRYTEQEICVYSMMNFPKVYKCAKFEEAHEEVDG